MTNMRGFRSRFAALLAGIEKSQVPDLKKRSIRYSRYSRFSKFGRSSQKLDEEIYVRKPLAEYISEELEKKGRALFYQRLYILGKNIRSNEESNPNPPVSISSMQHSSQSSLATHKLTFNRKLKETLEYCEKQAFTFDALTGLCLFIGDEYTLLIVESCEVILGDFCVELSKNLEQYWESSRVFLVEDNIDDVYFPSLLKRKCGLVNVNEKFTPATSDDEELMEKQHYIIKDKLHAFCEMLSKEVALSDDKDDYSYLPVEYNKLMVEVQRIELVFNSTRFYRTLPDFAQTYTKIPIAFDPDQCIWPMPFSYTPVGVFARSEYDVNLTFSGYGTEESKTEEGEDQFEEEVGADNESKKEEDVVE